MPSNGKARTASALLGGKVFPPACIALALVLFGFASAATSQERAPVSFAATQMGHSAEATIYSDIAG